MEIKTKRKKNYKAIIRRNITAWLIMLPSLLLFAFFIWIPLGKNILVSFFDGYDLENFVGFENYKAVFEDDSFKAAIVNTFKYIFWSILIGYFIPIIIGFLLSEVIHAKGFFRVCIYLPCMLSGIAVVFLFKNIYGDEPYSILNVILNCFGIKDQLWAGNADLIIPLIVLAMTWRGAGGTALIYLSNFQQIDTNLYDAARIDGASPFYRFIKITLPGMKTTLITLFALQVISVFQVFYEPWIIGGKTNDSISMMLLSYLYAFNDFEYGKSAASSIILALIIIAFTILYFALTKYLNKEEHK